MKLRLFLTIALAAAAGTFAWTRPHSVPVPPTDLRDAVADNSAMEQLKGDRDGMAVPEVPVPAQLVGERSASKSIYGEDDRLDYFEASPEMRKLADSVVSLWEAKKVNSDGVTASLKVTNYGVSTYLCPGQKFSDQPIGGFCSGTLVGEDLVLTAGHCITNEAACADTKLVFGFAVKQPGVYPTSVPEGDVYGCKRIIKRDLTEGFLSSLFHNTVNGGPGPDYAVIQLDRKPIGRNPLPINRGGKVKPGAPLFVIGHPVGLPVKVAGNASVRTTDPKYFFLADLDTFGGNSGSAVFNANTGLIEGILVRGDRDFVEAPAPGTRLGVCLKVAQVPQNGGKGEAVTKIGAAAKYIP